MMNIQEMVEKYQRGGARVNYDHVLKEVIQSWEDRPKVLYFESILSKALEENYINEREWQSLKEWKLDPHKWSEEAIKNNL